MPKFPGESRASASEEPRGSVRMLTSPAVPSAAGRLSFLLVETGVSLITFGFAFCYPQFGSRWFSNLERFLGRMARRTRLSVAVVGLTALALRLLILPVSPIPQPFIHDEFSYLLAADTFSA